MSFHTPHASRIVPLLALLLAPGIASASTAVVTPLIVNGVDAKLTGAVSGLLSSELDFSGSFDKVTELPAAPATLTDTCITSTSCLGAIARSVGADAVLTGTITSGGKGILVSLVLYDAGRNTIRSKATFDVASDPSTLANNAGSWVKQLLSGQSAAALAAAAAPVVFEEEDTFAFEGAGDRESEPSADSKRSRSASRSASAVTPTYSDGPIRNTAIDTTPSPRPLTDHGDDDLELEDTRAADAAQAKAVADAAQARAVAEAAQARAVAEAAQARAVADAEAAAEARAKAEAAARVKAHAAASAVADAADDDFSFGSSVGLMAFEPDPEADEADQADQADDERRALSRSFDEDEPEDDRSARTPTSRSGTRMERQQEKPRVGLAARAGYSRYFDFEFVTYGAEVAIPVSRTVQIVAGIEGFSTERQYDDKVVEQLAAAHGVSTDQVDPSPWQTILPVNLGVLYKSSKSAVRPYGGLDLTMTPYTKAFDLAFGARGRAGADFMVGANFGLNLNLSVGILWGDKFELMQQGIENFGVIPQISGGTVFQF